MLTILTKKDRENIIRGLYTKNTKISGVDAARQTGASYNVADRPTNAVRRISPSACAQSMSRTEREEYRARQRVNPDTGRQFESKADYLKYQAKQRASRNKNSELSDFVE